VESIKLGSFAATDAEAEANQKRSGIRRNDSRQQSDFSREVSSQWLFVTLCSTETRYWYYSGTSDFLVPQRYRYLCYNNNNNNNKGAPH
jgi:hypothetical protein